MRSWPTFCSRLHPARGSGASVVGSGVGGGVGVSVAVGLGVPDGGALVEEGVPPPGEHAASSRTVVSRAALVAPRRDDLILRP
jgi:hypothetical protein